MAEKLRDVNHFQERTIDISYCLALQGALLQYRSHLENYSSILVMRDQLILFPVKRELGN